MKRRAFTLIELLVVIAIIAILAAILFPVFAKAREKARTAACESNCKQIGLAFVQYVQDFDEKYPPMWVGPGGNNMTFGSEMLVQPYIKNQQAFICPSDTNPNAGPSGWLGAPGNFKTSYLYNWNVGWNMNAGTTGIAMAACVSPATTVCFACGGVQTNTTTPYVTVNSPIKASSWILWYPNDGNVSGGNGDWAGPAVRHNGMTVCGYLDGHVKVIMPDPWYYPATPWMDPTIGG
jgi:prepilin-type N-terminal cleavage/methylation domain-containing protein/prepilin-type processing-associated H-X9-DG protein